MGRNPFAPFPSAPPARVLLYGDPGTQKTRRCLSELPGPIAYIDMESGGLYYADLPPKGSGYMLTRSASEVRDALDFLASPEGTKAYRSVVIDPIGIVWEQLQEAHKIRAAERGKRKNPGMTADDVLMDVSAWGRVKAQHGNLITRALNLSQHVVFIARGADQINEKGDVIGYKAQCEKSIAFLVSTVIQTRHGFDVVEKDRSGALKEGRQSARVSLKAVTSASGTTVSRLAAEDEAATRDARDLEPEEQRRDDRRQEPATQTTQAKPEMTPEQRLNWLADALLDLDPKLTLAFIAKEWRLDPPVLTTEHIGRLKAYYSAEKATRKSAAPVASTDKEAP